MVRSASGSAKDTTPSRPSPRRPRRAALRTSTKAITLSQRRAHFDRIVQNHITRLNDAVSTEQWRFDRSLLHGESVSLDAEFAESALRAGENAPHRLHAQLLELKKVTSLTSAVEEDVLLSPGMARDDEGAEFDIQSLATAVSSDVFVNHEMSEIRLFSACILAEILRITAPKPPLSRSKLGTLSTLFIDELASLACENDPLQLFRFSLLEQLASVKVFAIYAEDEHVTADVFACFYSTSRSFQPAKYREYMGYILCTLLEEVESIDQALLDAVLAPLCFQQPDFSTAGEAKIRSTSPYSSSAISLAGYVISNAKSRLQVPVCNFFNATLDELCKTRVLKFKEVSSSGRRSSVKSIAVDVAPDSRKNRPSGSDTLLQSELLDSVESLLISVHKIEPDMLIYVLPGLEDRLRAKEEIIRRNAAYLLTIFFTSCDDAVNSYHPLFNEFLSRTRDVDPVLRAVICSAIGPLILSQPRHRSMLEKRLQDRLVDKDEHVRQIAVKSVGQSGAVASTALMKAFSDRFRDRKSAVRIEAFRQLTVVCRSQLKLASPLTPELKSPVKLVGTVQPGSGSSPLNQSSFPPSEIQKPSESHIPGEPYVENEWTPKVPEWMAWLPDTLLTAHQSLQNEDNAAQDIVERIIFDQLYLWDSDSSLEVERRIRGFSSVLGNLRAQSFLYLSNIVAHRARLVSTVRKIISIRLSSKHGDVPLASPHHMSNENEKQLSTPVGKAQKTFSKHYQSPPTGTPKEGSSMNPSRRNGELRSAAELLSNQIRLKKYRNEEVSQLCWKICNVADRRFYEQLESAVNPKLIFSLSSVAGQEAIARVSSKSILGEFLAQKLFPKVRPGLFSNQHLRSVADLVQQYCRYENLESGANSVETSGVLFLSSSLSSFSTPSDVIRGALRYLELASLHVPASADCLVEIGYDLVRSSSHEKLHLFPVLLCGLKILARVGAHSKHDQAKELIPQLESIMTAPVVFDAHMTGTMSKWAAHAFTQIFKQSSLLSEVIGNTLSVLVSVVDTFQGNALELVGPISALDQFAKRSPNLFKSKALELFDFSRSLLCGTFNSKIWSEENGRNVMHENETITGEPSLYARTWLSSFAPTCEICRLCATDVIVNVYKASLAELARRSIKLILHSVHCLDGDDEEVHAVLKILNEASIAKNGDIFGIREIERSVDDNSGTSETKRFSKHEMASTTSICNIVRLAASCGVVSLARSKSYFRKVSPSDFLCAMLCAQDENPDVRIGFGRAILRCVLGKRLPFRWIVTLSLMAVDPDKTNHGEVRGMLSTALRWRRRQLLFSQTQMASIRKLLPEASVPILIWVLANHPDSSSDQSSGYQDAQRCLDLLLDRLLESNEYAAVLNEYLEVLVVARDISDPPDQQPGPVTDRIRALARICSVLLKKKQAGRRWNLLQHPGHVELPSDLFQVERSNVENSAAPPPSLLGVAKTYDADMQNNQATFKNTVPEGTQSPFISGTTPLGHLQTPPSTVDSLKSHLKLDHEIGTAISSDTKQAATPIAGSESMTRSNIFDEKKRLGDSSSHSSDSCSWKRRKTADATSPKGEGQQSPSEKIFSQDDQGLSQRVRPISQQIHAQQHVSDKSGASGTKRKDLSTMPAKNSSLHKQDSASDAGNFSDSVELSPRKRLRGRAHTASTVSADAGIETEHPKQPNPVPSAEGTASGRGDVAGAHSANREDNDSFVQNGDFAHEKAISQTQTENVSSSPNLSDARKLSQDHKKVSAPRTSSRLRSRGRKEMTSTSELSDKEKHTSLLQDGSSRGEKSRSSNQSNKDVGQSPDSPPEPRRTNPVVRRSARLRGS